MGTSTLTVLMGKAGFALCGALVALFLCSRRFVDEVSDKTFWGWGAALFVASRFGFFCLVSFVFWAFPDGDLYYYESQARDVLRGLIPNRDFPSSYGQLFPYIGAGLLTVWNSKLSFVLFAIVLDAAAVFFWCITVRKSFAESGVRRGFVWYTTSTLALTNVALNGQNNIWIAFALAFCIWLESQNKSLLAGGVIALAAVAVKLLALLFVPVLFFFSKARSRWLLGFLFIFVGVNAVFVFQGAAPFSGLTREYSNALAGNLPLALSFFCIPTNGVGWAFIALVLFGALTYRCYCSARNSQSILIQWQYLSLFILTLFLCLLKAGPYYLTMGLIPLCYLLAVQPSWVVRLWGQVLLVTGAFLPSLWSRLLNDSDFRRFWTGGVDSPSRVDFLLVLVVHVLFLAALILVMKAVRPKAE